MEALPRDRADSRERNPLSQRHTRRSPPALRRGCRACARPAAVDGAGLRVRRARDTGARLRRRRRHRRPGRPRQRAERGSDVRGLGRDDFAHEAADGRPGGREPDADRQCAGREREGQAPHAASRPGWRRPALRMSGDDEPPRALGRRSLVGHPCLAQPVADLGLGPSSSRTAAGACSSCAPSARPSASRLRRRRELTVPRGSSSSAAISPGVYSSRWRSTTTARWSGGSAASATTTVRGSLGGLRKASGGGVVGEIGEHDLAAQRPRVGVVDRAVDDDPVQPRPEPTAPVEAVERAHGGQERLLRDVLGRRRVPHDEVGGPVRHSPVGAEQQLERAGVAALRGAHEAAVAGPRRARPGRRRAGRRPRPLTRGDPAPTPPRPRRTPRPPPYPRPRPVATRMPATASAAPAVALRGGGG